MNFSANNYINFETFDEKKLDILIQLGKDLNEDVLSEMLATYFSSTDQTVEMLKINFANSDFASIARLTHKHKSSCGQLGLIKLHKLCTDLETYLKPDNTFINSNDVMEFLNAIYLEIDLTGTMLRNFLKAA
ncbi:MAG: Hpt domain-containing protein [Pseudobdellovibrio sp.]